MEKRGGKGRSIKRQKERESQKADNDMNERSNRGDKKKKDETE